MDGCVGVGDAKGPEFAIDPRVDTKAIARGRARKALGQKGREMKFAPNADRRS